MAGSLPTLLGALALGIAANTVHARVAERRATFPDDVDVLYVPPAAHLRPMAVGYREALADLLWVRALLFSGKRLSGNNTDAIVRYTDGIVGLSPRFKRAYRWGGVTAIYGGGATVSRPMVEGALNIYRRGLEQFPEEHELLYPTAMLLTYQVGSTAGYSAQERELSRTEGMELLRQAAAFGADPLVRQYAATLITEHATDQLARQFLISQLAQSEDEDYRRLLRKKLSRLVGATSVEEIESVRRRFIERHLRDAPYTSDSVFTIILDEHAPKP